MSDKCMKISSCASFLIISGILFVLSLSGPQTGDSDPREEEQKITTLTFSHPKPRCNFLQISDYKLNMITPSLESFIRASTGMKDQELRLSGLAVFSKLANACQPLADVSKAKIQVHKIALISLANETACPLQGLVGHAQNRGYSVVIFFGVISIFRDIFHIEAQPQEKLLIPILSGPDCWSTNQTNGEVNIDNTDLLAADRTNVEIAIMPPGDDDLKMMQQYLRRLYCWFLFGPLITLEWLRRRKKLCCMSGGGRVPEETTVESRFNSAADHQETQRHHSHEAEYEQTGGETQPLLLVLTRPFSYGHRGPSAIRQLLLYLRKLFCKVAVRSGYVILIVVALPVGISSGGWSFFRFDQNENNQQEKFWDDLMAHFHLSFNVFDATYLLYVFFDCFLPLWWSPLQIFCFFLYSRFACKTTWTVPTNFSKLIRSDWFSSNMYLLLLGIVVPYCSSGDLFAYFATYDMVCTICNLLFVIILNKHKFVTRYVFYISVCMICAYIESDIVAVFYFVLNSEGSLSNLKLTALRTVAIGLTLTLSLSSSMHIIRKLTKPQESLFEGLGEK